jgi:hypothetical protein
VCMRVMRHLIVVVWMMMTIIPVLMRMFMMIRRWSVMLMRRVLVTMVMIECVML